MLENGLCPIDNTTPDDVFLCGFPRSGHTWSQNLIAGILHGVDPEFAHDSLIQDLVPTLDYKRYFKRYGNVTCFKTHALPQPQFRRVICLLRDGRDAMVSYYHYLRALQGPLDFFRLVQGEGLTPCHWHEHVEAWSANPYQAVRLVVRYEDLNSEPVRELRRICAFLRIERDDEHLAYIARKASFKNARKKEQTQGWDNQAWPRDQPFVRRGEVGSYRDEMPPSVLAAFLKKAGPTLARCGYDIP